MEACFLRGKWAFLLYLDMRFYIVVFFLALLLFCCSQKDQNIDFIRIPNENFIRGTLEEDTNLNVYICQNCEFAISYNYSTDYKQNEIVIGIDTFKIDEILVPEKIEVYKVNHQNSNFIFLKSADFSAQGKAYSLYRNYYLFSIKNKQVTNFSKLILSKMQLKEAFINLTK